MISVVNLKHLLILMGSLLLGGCLIQNNNSSSSSDGIKEIQGEIFGSYFIVKYYGEKTPQDLRPELDKFFKEFNTEFSTYQKDSVISSLNSLPLGRKLKVSSRFIEMLKMAREFYQQTSGAFDPTLGPVIKLWGFGGARISRPPTDSEIKTALKNVGFNHLEWNENEKLVWKNKAIVLDVNAFAPGWAADLIGKILERFSIKSYMVDISGEILFKGVKANGKNWVTGIEKPSDSMEKSIYLAFGMLDGAIATSGDYRQFFNDQGIKRSHLISPQTGRPVTHDISSATVLAHSAAKADAWSTALMVLGEAGVELAERHGIKVFLLKAVAPKVFNPIISPTMKSYLDAHSI